MKVFIYALVDPRDGITRYIGKANNVKHRVQNHLCPANLQRTRHVCRWLAGLVVQGLTPKVVILEETSHENWQVAEREWIAMFRARGILLTNLLEGGEGGATYGRLGKKNTLEHNAKVRAARLGRSINQSDKNGKRAAGIRAAWERRRREAEAKGVKLSWGNHSEATKQQIAKKAKGRDTTHAWIVSIANRKKR